MSTDAASAGPATPSRQPAAIPGAVRVTAADFNGHSFDGSPFKGDADWLMPAIAARTIAVADVTDRDYAVFDVLTADGIVRAFPGDQITMQPGELPVVHPHPESLSDPARIPRVARTAVQP